jgi:hypothetical protein
MVKGHRRIRGDKRNACVENHRPKPLALLKNLGGLLPFVGDIDKAE